MDIIRMWVFYIIFRMWVFIGEKFWYDIFINGMVVGLDGRKMSKSYGNVVVLDEVILKYGVDVLRFWMVLVLFGEDYLFKWEIVDYNYCFF